MSLAKFKDLLETSKLYFCRLDKFENDPYEGVVPEKNYGPDSLITVHHSDLVFEITGPDTYNLGVNNQKKLVPLKEHYGKDYEQSVKDTREKDLFVRQGMFANCWHKNSFESEAFWRIYRTNELTVAIKTNVLDLRKSVVDRDSVYICDVQYYEESDSIPEGNSLYQASYKRKQFEYEKEVRLIYLHPEVYKFDRPRRDCYKAYVDIKTLVSEVWLSPTSTDNEVGEIKQLLNKAKLDPALKRSTVLKRP